MVATADVLLPRLWVTAVAAAAARGRDAEDDVVILPRMEGGLEAGCALNAGFIETAVAAAIDGLAFLEEMAAGHASACLGVLGAQEVRVLEIFACAGGGPWRLCTLRLFTLFACESELASLLDLSAREVPVVGGEEVERLLHGGAGVAGQEDGGRRDALEEMAKEVREERGGDVWSDEVGGSWCEQGPRCWRCGKCRQVQAEKRRKCAGGGR